MVFSVAPLLFCYCVSCFAVSLTFSRGAVIKVLSKVFGMTVFFT